MRIKLTRKDGTVKEWPDERRPGGSYRNKVEAQGEFLVVTDVWGNQTWVPAADVLTMETFDR